MSAELEALARRVAELEAELRRGRPGALPAETSGWDDDADGAVPSHDWLAWLEPPFRSRPRIPRLPFEILFLAACAVAAGVADLEPIVIAAVMAGAWALVSLTELAAARADRRRRLEDAAIPARIAAPRADAVAADPAWFAPPVEQTIVNMPAVGDAATAVTRMRSPMPASDLEQTAER